MAIKRYEREVQVQPNPIDTSQASTSQLLADKLRNFSAQTARIGHDMLAEEGAKAGAAAGTKAPEKRSEWLPGGSTFNRAAVKAHAAAVDSDIRVNMERLATENPADPEAFEAATGGYAEGLLKSVSPDLRPQVEQEIELQRQRYRTKIEDNERKMLAEENTAELVEAAQGLRGDALAAARDGDLDIVEHQREKYLSLIRDATASPENPLAPFDPNQAKQLIREIDSGIDRELILGDFERVLRESGVDAGEQALTDFEAKKVKDLGDLLPEDRDALLGAMNARLSRAIADENREQAKSNAAERARLKALKDRSDRAIATLEAGFLPEGLDELATDAAGTELEPEIQRATALARHGARFALTPPTAQLDAINAIESDMRGRAVDPIEVERLDLLKKINKAHETALDKDPMSLAIQQGIVDAPEPLNFTDLDALGAGLGQRVALSEQAQAHYGRRVSPFTAAEADMLGDTLQQSDAVQRTQLLGLMVDGLGHRALDGMEQLHKQGFTGYAFIGGVALERGPGVARDILLGQEAMSADTKLKPSDTDSRPDLERVRAAYPARAGGAAIQSIEAYYARLSQREGDHSGVYDPDRMERAVEAVTGGIVEWESGKQTSYFPAPDGVDSDKFEDWMDSLTPEDLEKMGGIAGISAETALEQIRDRGRLIAIGDDEFLVTYTSPDGQPRYLMAANPDDPTAPEFRLKFNRPAP